MKTLSTPPAIWLAFVRAGRWKSWALGSSLLLNLLTTLVALAAMAQDPDVVLVAESGESHYLARSLAGDELVRFLKERRHAPTDLEAAFFARQFMERLLAINSTTLEEDLGAAVEMMTPDYAARFLEHAEQSHLFETYALAAVRSRLDYQTLEIRERSPGALHVHAKLTRSKHSLAGRNQEASIDRLVVDLVLRVVPRTPSSPSALRVQFARVEADEGETDLENRP